MSDTVYHDAVIASLCQAHGKPTSGDCADAFIKTLAECGYVIVPIKPTETMIEAGCDNNPTQWNEGTDLGFAADVANDVYVGMVRAASR